MSATDSDAMAAEVAPPEPAPPRPASGARGTTTVVALVLIWLIAGAFNLGKAVHVDDTAYLEIAEAIVADPLHPMNQLVNWGDQAEPIHRLNQPHLLFYVMALAMKLLPAHAEGALRLTWLMFSGAAICLYYAFVRRGGAPRPLLATALLCLGPAFVPAQNLMVDVPLLALWLGFFLLLERTATLDPRAAQRPLLAAGLVLGAACLVKYVSLVLLPIFVATVLWRAGRRALWLVLVPLGVLGAWSALNWLDYGGVHILSRPAPAASHGSPLAKVTAFAGRGVLWVIALGAASPFALAFVRPLARSSTGRWLLGGMAALAAAVVLGGRLALPREPAVQSALRGLFLANGVLVIGLALRATRWRPRDWWDALRAGREPRGWIHLAWTASAAAFIVVLAPFIAVRHALLAMPPIYLQIHRGPDAAQLTRRGLALALGLNVVVGVVLAISGASRR